MESRSKKRKKQASSQPVVPNKFDDKDLSYGKRTLFSCEMLLVILSMQGSFSLPAGVANQSPGFGSSCPLLELSIIIIIKCKNPN